MFKKSLIAITIIIVFVISDCKTVQVKNENIILSSDKQSGSFSAQIDLNKMIVTDINENAAGKVWNSFSQYFRIKFFKNDSDNFMYYWNNSGLKDYLIKVLSFRTGKYYSYSNYVVLEIPESNVKIYYTALNENVWEINDIESDDLKLLLEKSREYRRKIERIKILDAMELIEKGEDILKLEDLEYTEKIFNILIKKIEKIPVEKKEYKKFVELIYFLCRYFFKRYYITSENVYLDKLEYILLKSSIFMEDDILIYFLKGKVYYLKSDYSKAVLNFEKVLYRFNGKYNKDIYYESFVSIIKSYLMLNDLISLKNKLEDYEAKFINIGFLEDMIKKTADDFDGLNKYKTEDVVLLDETEKLIKSGNFEESVKNTDYFHISFLNSFFIPESYNQSVRINYYLYNKTGDISSLEKTVKYILDYKIVGNFELGKILYIYSKAKIRFTSDKKDVIEMIKLIEDNENRISDYYRSLLLLKKAEGFTLLKKWKEAVNVYDKLVKMKTDRFENVSYLLNPVLIAENILKNQKHFYYIANPYPGFFVVDRNDFNEIKVIPDDNTEHLNIKRLIKEDKAELIKINGKKISTCFDYIKVMSSIKVGQKITLTLRKNGYSFEEIVTVDDYMRN